MCFQYILSDGYVHFSQITSSLLIHISSYHSQNLGTGLYGLIVASECMPEKMVLSDYDPTVVKNLKHNVSINNAKDVNIEVIDWRNKDTYPMESYDVITCADCVYDPEVIPSLIDLVDNLLNSQIGNVAYFASTPRNSETFGMFQREVRETGIKCVEIPPKGNEGRTFVVFRIMCRNAGTQY